MRRMSEGPRKRGDSAQSEDGDCHSDSGKDPRSSGVALKKEIGLFSACGIIVGKSTHELFFLVFVLSDVIEWRKRAQNL